MTTWTGISGDQHDARDHSALIDPAVSDAVAALVDAAPGTLDTLNELAAALGDDPAFATTVTTALAGKAATAHTHTGTYVAQTLFDAAGDLITATANDTPSRLAMGTALQVLRVNAGATALEYATPASGGGTSPLYDFGLIR